MVARDILNAADLDFNTVYASIKGTTKHVGCSFTEAEDMAPVFDMLYRVAGGEKNGVLVHLYRIVIASLCLH